MNFSIFIILIFFWSHAEPSPRAPQHNDVWKSLIQIFAAMIRDSDQHCLKGARGKVESKTCILQKAFDFSGSV